MDIIATGDVFYGDSTKAGSNFPAEFYGIYFGAHWAPPCRLFTTTLTEFYNETNKGIEFGAKKPFEVLFVSLDGNEEAFRRNFSEMPWLGISPKEEARVSALKQKYGVNGVPTLVITKPNGELITYDGRKDIQTNSGDAMKIWIEAMNKQVQQPAQNEI